MTLRRQPCLRDLGWAPGLVLLALSACQGPSAEQEEKVVSAVRHGHYSEAMEEARRLVEENPSDPQSQQLFNDTRVALMLDQARNLIFHGELTAALQLLHEAEQLAPEHPVLRKWIEKTRAQLAVEWLDHAADVTGPDRLDEAEQAFEKVLEYAPDNLDAKRGLSHVLLLKNYRAGQSKTYFEDGLASFRRLLLEQARRALMVSQRYHENEPASVRAGQVEKLMAEERLAQANSLEASGLFFAARNEYRLVLLINPDSAEARAGLDRMDREARAAISLDRADMEVRRGEFDDAQETLAGVEVLTDVQQDEISLLHTNIEEKRRESMYLEARSLTDDYRYPEAVESFDRLLAIAPDFKDAAQRRSTVAEFIRLSEEFYANALAATSDEVAEQFLRAIPVMWPEYRDVSERLKAIEARKAQAKAESGEPGDAGDEPR